MHEWKHMQINGLLLPSLTPNKEKSCAALTAMWQHAGGASLHKTNTTPWLQEASLLGLPRQTAHSPGAPVYMMENTLIAMVAA